MHTISGRAGPSNAVNSSRKRVSSGSANAEPTAGITKITASDAANAVTNDRVWRSFDSTSVNAHTRSLASLPPLEPEPEPFEVGGSSTRIISNPADVCARLPFAAALRFAGLTGFELFWRFDVMLPPEDAVVAAGLDLGLDLALDLVVLLPPLTADGLMDLGTSITAGSAPPLPAMEAVAIGATDRADVFESVAVCDCDCDCDCASDTTTA